jgi:ATP-dependent Lon protease
VLRKTATTIASLQSRNGASPKPASEDAAAEASADGAEAPKAKAKAGAKAAQASSKAPASDRTAKAAASVAASKPVTIDIDVVRDALGRQKFFQESAARTATPGVATGLSVTMAGGDVLFIEAAAMKNGGKGGLVLTGQLGDVMKESAQIALSYVRGHADELGIDESAFEKTEFHIPKDGPSAGVTMVTALASLLTGRPVKHTVGMTGEVTLQGRVLPIGGLKQKALAAHAAGLTDVILPERNRGDLDEIPEDVRAQMTFHPVMTVQEVLDRALEPAPTVAHA